MRKNTLKASVPMALTDAIPVICFGISSFMIAARFRSALFVIGALSCLLAGTGKVLWKLVLAIAKKDVPILKRYFRVMMGGGFLLMLLAAALAWKRIPVEKILEGITAFPGGLLFSVGILGMCAMGFMGAKLDTNAVWVNWLEQCVNVVAQLALLCGVVLVCFGVDAYPPADRAQAAMVPSETVAVVENKDGILFDGAGEELLIFYPGACVEAEAYAPLMRLLAENGLDTCVVKVPYGLAMLKENAADYIMEAYPRASYCIGGHSLGGVVAASYASKHPEKLKTLILLAAYPSKNMADSGLRVLSLYGDRDTVLDRARMESAKSALQGDTVYVEISGANHAGFGDYGPQKGDGEALITSEAQWQAAADAILEFCAAS